MALWKGAKYRIVATAEARSPSFWEKCTYLAAFGDFKNLAFAILRQFVERLGKAF
jgi:hypothetical protein